MHRWQQENLHAIALTDALRHELGLTIPVDYAAAIRAHQIAIVYKHDAPAGFFGHFENHDATPVIVLNARRPARQLRYAALHELAHYLIEIQRLQVRPAREERICQVFAANLCMPPAMVRTAADQLYGLHEMLDYLSVMFGVTREAMCIQLKLLRVLPGLTANTASAEEVVAGRVAFDALIACDLGEAIPQNAAAGDGFTTVPIYDIDVDAIYRIPKNQNNLCSHADCSGKKGSF